MLSKPLANRLRGYWPYLWFAAVAVAVLGPLLASGYVLLLDWKTGPRPPWPSPFPLPSEGGLATTVPIATLLRVVAAAAPELVTKLVLVVILLTGSIGLYRFLVRDVDLAALPATASGTLYAINPFVYQRMIAGQLLLLLAYSLLPWMLSSLAAIATTGDRGALLRGLLLSALIGIIDVHAAAPAGLLLIGAIAVSPPALRVRFVKVSGVAIATLAVHAYWITPAVMTRVTDRVGSEDLGVFASRPRGPGVLPRVLLLHGFWYTEFQTPLGRAPGMFLVSFGAILALVACGVVATMRSARWRRPAGTLCVVGLLALILGMGTSFPPTSALTRLLWDHLPAYTIYREPHKWIGLWALVYAVFFGVGLQSLLVRVGRSGAPLMALALLPLIACPTILWGFGGQVSTSSFPRAWEAAERQMRATEGSLLFLPWHAYQPFPFAGGRNLSTPADDFFSNPVISSGDPELAPGDTSSSSDPRDDYLVGLLRRSQTLQLFGHLVAPLGVRYVALADIADAAEYRWLSRQEDLRPLLRKRTLSLWENEAWNGDVYGLIWPEPRPRLGGVSTALDPVDAPFVGTDLACGDGWTLNGREEVCHLGAVAAFGRTGSSLTPKRPGIAPQVLSYLLSGVTVVVLVGLVERNRRRKIPRGR